MDCRSSYALKQQQHKKYFWLLLLTGITLILIYSNVVIYSAGKRLNKTSIAMLQPADVVIALGSKVYKNGQMSDVFKDRLDTALQVYRAGKAPKILISGDHGQMNYDEVNTGKHYLLSQGVKPADLFLDHAGFDTFDSMYRAQYIFNVHRIIITTQQSHLPRALYLAEGLGMQAQGLNSNAHLYHKSLQVHQFVRERLANVKAFLNIATHAKPKFLGASIDINGDGQKSWDTP